MNVSTERTKIARRADVCCLFGRAGIMVHKLERVSLEGSVLMKPQVKTAAEFALD